MARSAEENALAAVEKAIKAHDTALEKAEAAQAKADEAVGKANRADRELKWTASHPDLPEDFDLDDFRKSLEAPFEEIGDEIPVPEPKDALEEDKDQPDVGSIEDAVGPADDDDPFGDDA